MRVLLINPWSAEILPPPAIGYLQSALKQQGVNVTACNYSNSINLNEYDIVGVTFHSFSVKFAKEIRERFNGRLICGGHHPSALPEQMLSIGYDQVVIGEGENAIIDIIQGNTDRIVKDNERKYFNGINDIPIPDYTGLSFGGEMGVNIITSRGCPFSCSFCASSAFWGHKYKTRSADSVLQEIEKRLSEGFKSWIFEDDNFTANRKRAIEICKALDGYHTWQCTSRAESLDPGLCNELYRAGCRKVWIGVESLSQGSLDRCGKNTTVEKILRGIENAEKAGIKTVSLFILGLPGDTIKDIQETHNTRMKSRITDYGTNIAWILPNTEIYHKAKEYGFDDSVYLESGAPFYTYEQSIETLQNWATQI